MRIFRFVKLWLRQWSWMTNWIKRASTNSQLYRLIIWLALEWSNGAVVEPREKVSLCYHVQRKLIIAGAVVNAIIDLLFIKSNHFVNRVHYTYHSLYCAYGHSRNVVILFIYIFSEYIWSIIFFLRKFWSSLSQCFNIKYFYKLFSNDSIKVKFKKSLLFSFACLKHYSSEYINLSSYSLVAPN